MKRILCAGMLLIVFTGFASADTAKSSGITVSASMADQAFMVTKVKSLDGTGAAATLSWKTQVVGSSWQGADQCLELKYHTTSAMLVRIYTNNITSGPCLGFSTSTINTTYVPVAWLATHVPLAPTAFGEPVDALVLNPVTCSTGTVNTQWHRLQDLHDGTTISYLLSGGPSDLYTIDGLQMPSPVYLYFEGDFSSANANETYNTTLHIDLIHQ